MNEIIWRLESLWIGKETTAWIEASAFSWIPLTNTGYIKPVTEYIENESWIWRIESLSSKDLVKNMSETSIEWRVWQITIWHMLTALFGTSSSPALVEALVYKHSFTVTNTNNHKSYSIVTNGNTQDLSLYNMLDTFWINAEVWNVINFTWLFKGKSVGTTTGKTVTYTNEKPFKVCWMNIKFADNIAWLSAAAVIPMQSLNFEISKNVIDITSFWSCDPVSLHNQQFSITWDMEIIYRDNTYRTYNTTWTQKAMRITILGETLIWATKYAELNFDFGLLNFDEWDRSNNNDEIVTQNMWFTWLYSIADSSMLTSYLQNTQSTQY